MTPSPAHPLNLPLPVLAATNRGSSEIELVVRYPALQWVASLLFAMGLVCAVWLLVRWRRGGVAGVPRVPWGIREVLVASLGGLVIMLAGGAALAFLANAAALPEETMWAAVLGGEMALRVALIVALLWFWRILGQPLRNILGARPHLALLAMIGGTITLLGAVPFVSVTMALSTLICRALGVDTGYQPVAALFLTTGSGLLTTVIALFAVAVAPVFEELLFRGFIYPALRQRWGLWPALLLVAGLFAAVHFHLPSTAPLFVLGLGLGLAYEWTGSLVAPITMHALFNTGNILLLLFVKHHS